MLKIQYSDVNWTGQDGSVYLMDGLKEFYINGQLIANYIPPVITEDTIEGRTIPVQINQWESYIAQIASKEQGIHLLAKIQACSYVSFTDLTTNESIILDMQNGGLQIEAGDRYLTSNQSFRLILKTKKICTYPGIAASGDYILRIDKDAVSYYFYTDIQAIDFVTDVEQTNIDRQDGIKRTVKTVSKVGQKVIIFLNNFYMRQLKGLIENIGYSNIVYEENTPIETPLCKITEFPEGLYKCEIDLIYSININYA